MTGNEIYFTVENGGVRVRSMRQFESRGESALELLHLLLARWPEALEGKSGVVFGNDAPPDDQLATEDLNFCTTKRIGYDGPWLPFPDYTFRKWPQVGIPDAETLTDDLLADEREWESPKIFWIGTDQHTSRRALHELANHHPATMDVELMEWDRSDPNVLVSRSRQVSLRDHRLFKYLVDCPGQGYSARLKWLLATGRPVFLVARDVVEPWHEWLEPWIHYVPVSSDLGDLLENHVRLENDPALYEMIGENARRFVAEKLTIDSILMHTSETIRDAPGHPTPSNSSIIDPFGIHRLQEWLAGDGEYHWFVDPAVYHDGDWEVFEEAFRASDADLLTTDVRRYNDDPGWTWWPNLASPETEDPREGGMAALWPLMRFSRPAAEAVLQGIRDGWTGHIEALIPTLVHRANLKIEDIGGSGHFTPPERICRWYDLRTWKWQGPIHYIPGLFHFPVPLAAQPLAFPRLKLADPGQATRPPRLLYVSPVGEEAAHLLSHTLRAFQSAEADCLLLQYDEALLDLPEGVRVIRDKGTKWELGCRHLRPELVEEYDFVFFWDDDLSTEGFDPAAFVRVMELNRLAVAQPAIRSPYDLSHQITRQVPCPPPLREPDGQTLIPVVGRLTNFVEIMAPVFSREAWRELYAYVVPENSSGWGYDYIPLGRKGIVDVMPVIHTRPVQSLCSEAESDLAAFLGSQGLHRLAHQETGLLFDTPRKEKIR